MLKKLAYFLPTIALLFTYFLFGHPKNKENVVVKVIDGDTLELGDGKRIRLLGIDAPEIGEPFSEEAKLMLEEMVKGKKIILEEEQVLDKDKYGRLLRYVFVDGKLVNCELVKLGLARVLIESEVKYNCLQQAEKEAREKKLGIWSSS